MWVPGIESTGTAFAGADGNEYNYLMQFETREAAMKFAQDWATRKTPAAKRNRGDIIKYTAKELETDRCK